MWSDLAALTPPLVVCVAVLIGVAMLLRSQMSPKRRAERDERRRTPGFILPQKCANWANGMVARSIARLVHDLLRAAAANGSPAR